MNHIYRVIWSHGLNIWVVASEKTNTSGKHGGGERRSTASTSKTAHPSLRALASVCGLSRQWRGTPLVSYALPLSLLLAVGNALAQTPPAPNALPTGGVVSAGSATISTNGNRLQINQGSDRAALNWNTFNIGSNAGVSFIQPSSGSVALNRVASNNPSQIFGSLSANGKVILINPNGVVFGQGAQINSAGLIATTKALSDADFMAGNYNFIGIGGTGLVQNAGNIVASPGGTVLLMADRVINTGSIKAPAGTVGLLAGSSMQVTPDWQAVTIAPGSAAAATDVVVNNSGVIDVSAAQGGNIVLNGGTSGITQSSGQLLATGATGNGGQVRVLGYNVGLMGGSVTDVSGQSGGGSALIGGNWQGSGPEQHASATYLDQAASVKADALGNGNGGKVVLWSDNYTKVDGAISARGGVLGGNGGQIETSSHGTLVANSVADTAARSSTGKAGSWLLDPSDVTIVATGGGALTGGVFNPAGAAGTVSNTTINNALNAGTNVTISTSAGTGGNGTLTQNAGANITKTAGADSSLTLIANRAMALNGDITASGTGKLNVVLNGTNSISEYGNINTNGGTLSFQSGVYAAGAAPQTWRTAGGAINFSSDLLIANPQGLTIDSATGSSTAAGTVTFGGNVDSGDSYSYGASAGSWSGNNGAATSGPAGAVGSSSQATPQSALENSVVNYTSGFTPISLGAAASGPTGVTPSTPWSWVGGAHSGQIFNTTGYGNNPATLPNGAVAFTNWAPGQPNPGSPSNNALGANALGQWYPLAPVDPGGYVKQTILATSPLTVNAGTSAVTFNGRVGSVKPLASLTVTGPTAINGGQVTTEQGQTYNSPIVLGSASTLMESTKSSLQLDSNISYSGTVGSVLTMRAANDVIVSPGVSITSTGGALTTSLTADTTNTGSGAITLGGPISTNGGAINLTASSGISASGAALNSGSGAGNIAITNNRSGNIAFSGGSTISAGTGTVSVTNGLAAGVTGGGTIALQDISGAAVSVSNNVTDLAAGQNAITLNGPVSASGALAVLSKSGDILVGQNITSTLTNSPSAIILAAATPKTAADNTGGNVKLAGSSLTVDPTSRAIIYTGSLAGSTGVSSADVGYPGAGNYRYNVAYNGTGRLASNTGTYVQYREQPTLTMNLPGKVYDAQALNSTDWSKYTVTGWQNGDTSSINPLNGSLSINGSTANVAKNVATYAIALGSLADTLGYQLLVPTTSYTISPAPLTVTGDALSKSYGTSDPQPLTYTTLGLVGGETAAIALSGNQGRNPGENAGSYAETIGSLAAVNGNYTITYVPGNLAITKSSSGPLTVTSTALSKGFGSDDPTLTYTVTGSTFSGNVQSYDINGTLQTIALSNTPNSVLSGNLGRQSGENTGAYATTQGSLASTNYNLIFNPDSLTINPAVLAIIANAQSKDYGTNDPNLNYTFTNPTSAQVNSYDPNGNLVATTVPSGGGTLAITGHLGRVSGEDVGTYQIGLGSLTATSNYTINYTAADLTINKSSNPALALQVQADAQTKIYGQADPALSYQIGNPSVFVNRTVQSYDPNGNLHGVTLTDNAATALSGGLARLSGEDVGTYGINQGSLNAANYVLNYSPANFTITPAPLTIAGLIAQNKVYDTTTLAQISGGALTGVLASDSGNVSLSGSVVGNFSDKNVGNNKNVIVSNGGLSGSRAFNYYIDYIASGTTANITPAPLRISGVRPQDRVYDGTTNATFIGTPALSGVYASDIGSVSIPIQNVVGNFADKNAGVNKQVISNLAAAVLSGSEAGNYQIVGVDASVNSATISPAALLLSAVSTTKLFDGTRDSDGVVTAKGLVGGDTIANLHQVYNSLLPRGKNRSTLSAAGDYQINDGNNGGNYVVALLSAPGTIKPYPGTPNFGQDLVSASVLPDDISTRSASEDILQKMGQSNWLLNFDPRDIKSKSF